MTEPTIPPIHIALTRAEYARGIARCRYLGRRRFKSERPFYGKVINAVALGGLLVLVVLAANAFTVVSSSAAWTFFLALFAYGAFAVAVSQSGIVFRSNPLDDGAVLRPHTITLSEEGLNFESEISSGRFGWAGVRMVDDDAGLILIFVDRSNAYIVPRRAFPDAAAADRFVEIVRSNIG